MSSVDWLDGMWKFMAWIWKLWSLLLLCLTTYLSLTAQILVMKLKCVCLPLLVFFVFIFLASNYFPMPFSRIQFLKFLRIRTVWPTFVMSPRPENLKNEIIILDWTTFYNILFSGMWQDQQSQCAENRCFVTENRNFLDRSSALIFHGGSAGDLHWRDLPGVRYSWQKYIFFNMEPPGATPDLGWVRKDFFNLTMTYMKTSDVYYPYGILKKSSAGQKNKISRENLMKIAKSKTKMIAWIVSNCETWSKREIIVSEMENLLPNGKLDVFGKCGLNESRCNNCGDELIKDYKFYLSLENSVCNEYISEKFFGRIKQFAVPIVLRGADYKKIGAPRKSFIAVDSFPNLRSLVDYLIFLDKNLGEYVKHLEWRTSVQILHRDLDSWLCELCSKLHKEQSFQPFYPTTIRDIQRWWVDSNNCQNDFGLKYVQRSIENLE